MKTCSMCNMTVETTSEGESAGRRERKKRATRLALKAAAIDLVTERGYGNVTVEDIADAVDVSARTFFNYFASKEAAVIGDDPESVASLQSELLGLPHDLTAFGALRAVLLRRIEAMGEDIELSGEGHDVWLRRFSLVRSQPDVLVAYTKHLDVLERAIAQTLLEWLGGDESLRVYASLVTMNALGVMRVGATYWGGDGGTASLLEFVNAAFDLVGEGLDLDPRHGGRVPPCVRRFAERHETADLPVGQ